METRRTMDVVEHDLNWVRLFEIEKVLLTNVFGNNVVKIEHFGSTSIPGLAAKPIIDILVFVHSIEQVEQCNDLMQSYGYKAKGEHGMVGRRFFNKYGDDGVNKTHHVHIYEEGANPFIGEALLFRDFLRINAETCKKYERVKKELSQKYYHQPKEYTDGKTDCVMEILELAKAHFNK